MCVKRSAGGGRIPKRIVNKLCGISVSTLARAEARALLRLERELVALRANAWAAGKVREAVRA